MVFNLINNTTSSCDSGWSALSSNYDDKEQIESEYIVPLGSHSLARILTVLHLVYEVTVIITGLSKFSKRQHVAK